MDKTQVFQLSTSSPLLYRDVQKVFGHNGGMVMFTAV